MQLLVSSAHTAVSAEYTDNRSEWACQQPWWQQQGNKAGRAVHTPVRQAAQQQEDLDNQQHDQQQQQWTQFVDARSPSGASDVPLQ